jgi:hypothetical protein
MDAGQVAMGVQVPRKRWFLELHDLVHLRKSYFWKLEHDVLTIGFTNG